MEIIKKILLEQGGLLAVMVLVVIAVNSIMSGLSTFLDVIDAALTKLAPQTKTDVDDKALGVVHSIASFIKSWILPVLMKLTDFASANKEH